MNNADKRSLFQKTLSGSLLITGTTVGAGMLGIPLVTWQCGFVPALLITSVVWLFMLATGYLLTQATLKLPLGSSFSTLSEQLLGKKAKWFIAPTFLFLYYCLMIAYFAAGAPFFGLLVEKWLGVEIGAGIQNLIFGLFFGFIVFKGSKSIDRANIFLTLLMFASYLALLNFGFFAVKKELLARSAYPYMLFASPILFSAFGYHNVLPSLTTYLKKDVKALNLSLFIGTFIPFAIYVLWQWLVLGSVSPEALNETMRQGKPATYALAAVSNSAYIFPVGQAFAFFSIVTSLLGVSFSLIDFLKDSFKTTKISEKRSTLTYMTFIPPFIFATLNPGIFDEALGIAGGIGESLLNGIVPTLLFIKAKELWPNYFPKKWILDRPFLILLLLIAIGVMGIEVLTLIK